jgi:hypothetical protein
MGHAKTWLAAALIGVLVVAGGVFALVTASSHHSTPTKPAVSAPAQLPTITKALTPQDANQLIQGILAQVQQASNTPNGPQALTRAQAQAIVDQQQSKLGITTAKP